MSVASGVEFGDVCEAALALLPEIIGNIETVIGGVTIRRTGDIAVQVAVGGPVCCGDIIETTADGRIGIRFIDGTVFNLSRDTCVVLSEFIYDSNRNDSALVAVTRGTFAFMAGRVARTGSLWVDTPVGSIRSRAHAGGMGMLSLAALVFSFIKEAQAADPDVTFLDDDSITYKDFAHGAFELVTKEAIPRHIIVEDPGETIVLNRIGSSVSVNPVANSPARMQELQAAQQDVLANLQGWAPLGSSTPPFLSPQQLLQPINFIQPDTTHPQNSLGPLEFAVLTVPEVFIVSHPPPPPPPTLEITGIGGQIGVAADNIINVARANAGVEITGTTAGVEDGRIVTVILADSSNHVVYSGTAEVTNGTWSINLDPAEAKALADGIYTLTADTTNAAGDPAEASRAIRVDETPPTIAIHTIVGNDVVNVNAASTGFAITGTTTDAENGQPVTVKIVDGSGHVIDTFTTTLTNNSWSVPVSSTEAKLLHDGSYTVTADVSDSAGNPAPEATQALTVDETPPKVTWLPPAESGVEGATIALGTITTTVNSLPGHSNGVQSLVVSGIPDGAVLTDGENNFTASSGSTSVDVKNWNLSNLEISPPNDTNFTLTVTATDQDANVASASELVTVAPLAPGLNPVAAQGNEDTAIALNLGVTARSLLGDNGDMLPNSLNALVVSDIPVGATLSDGTGLPGHSFTASAGNTSQDVAGWNLSSLKIMPPTEFEGSFTLKIAATERDSEGDISATVTATEVVTVAPVAEPPTASAPATLALNESATGMAIAGVSVGPLAEDADDTVSATLTVSHGTLHVASLSGVTVTGDDCATLTLSGSAAAVNTLLAGLTYTPTTEYEGADTLHLSVTSSDGSNTYPTVAMASTAITVNPVARPPTANAPPTLTLNENATGVAIAGLGVGPLAEDADDTVSATLTVSQGTLHVANLSGVTVTGDDCATLTLSGSATAVNTLLAGLTYTPTTEYEGADTLHLSVTSSDGSSTYPTATTASTAITVKPVAEVPTATAPATLTFGEDDDTVAIAGVSVGPLAEDSDDTVSATLTVSHGTLHVGSLSGVTVTGDDSGTLTLSGSAAAVNKLLAGLTYMPFEEEGADTLHLSVTSSDGSNTYPTPATATTALRVEVDSESLIVGGPGPTLDWNNAVNWSAGVVPTLGIDVTINAPSNYTAIITGAPVAQAESLTIPHGAASTDIAVGGTLQLAGDINVSFSGKLENDGTLEEMANATFIGPLTNNGTIIVDPSLDLNVNSTITGIGKFWIDSGTTLEFALGSKVAPGTTDSQTIYFEQGAGKLVIDDWGKFAGVITGTDIGTHLTSSDLIDLTQLPFVGGSMSASVSYNSGTNISTVTFSDGNSANNVTLHLSGNYTGSAWSFKSINGGAGTETSDPPTAPATLTSGATGQIVAASATATDFAGTGGPNAILVPGNSQNFTRQVAGFTGDVAAGTLSVSQTLTSSPIKSAGGYGAFPMTAAAVWAYTPGNNSAANVPNIGDTLANIIMGGFGAVLLTGGNGNDTVVHSFVSDSNARQFDTITDFLSGSDKIDLTAFASVASVILALAPTSTAVPAHTIAWLYDSKANQTIVYVNPTDQTESIGDSNLLEIHLPPVATVHLSDFVLAPTATTIPAASDPSDLAVTPQSDATIVKATTADVSSDTTVSNSALFVAAQTSNIGDNADANRDDVDSINHAKFVSLDEGSVDNPATRLPDGLSVHLPQVTVTAPMQTSFASDQKPVSDRGDTTTIDHGASMHGPTVDGGSGIVPSGSDRETNPKMSSNGDNGALIPDNADGSHVQELDTHPIVMLDSRFLKTLENGRGDRSIASDAGEHTLHGPGVPDFEPSYLTQIMSGGTVGTLGDSFHFKDNSLGSKGSGVIGVAENNDVPVSMSHHLEATGTHEPLSISEGGVTPSTLGDSFHFRAISNFKGSGVNNFAEPDQIPTSITHNENAAVPHGPPPISAPQTIEMSLPGPQSADSLDVVLHHPHSHFVTHDLIV